MVKAARNAKRRLMPESLITKVIDMARREGKVRKLGPPEEPAVTRPAHPAAPPRQETRAPASEPDISQEDFVLQAKARGYGSWREILEALGMKSTREVREMGYRKALEQLPDRTRAEPEGTVEVVEEGILETREAQAEPAEVEADLDF
jgi:hypothetical protein